MEKEVKPWVVFAPLQDNCTEHKIIQNLFNTITESGCISDKKLFEKDMNDTILNRNGISFYDYEDFFYEGLI